MDVTQKIVNQIQTKCSKKGFPGLSPSLIHFIVQSIIVSKYTGTYLNSNINGSDLPNNPLNTSIDSVNVRNSTSPFPEENAAIKTNLLLADQSTDISVLTPAQILNVIDESCEMLCQPNNPRLATVKMQNAVLSSVQTIRSKQNDAFKAHTFKSEKLVEEIIKKREEAEVFGDIVLFILHETRLLNNSTEKIEKETMTALESVIPRNFVHSFITQDQEEKKNQLYDLWKIVWGIRLFNKASNKGGAGIERLTLHDPALIAPLLSKMEEEIEATQPLIQKYETILENNNRNSRLRQEFTNKRQYLAFLKKIHKQLNQLKINSNELEEAMKSTIDEIQDIVTQKTSVPKSTIYPLFIELAENWASTEDLNNQIFQLEEIFSVLYSHRDSFEISLNNPKFLQLQDQDDYDPEVQLESAKSNAAASEAKRIPATETIQPELAGFDPTTLSSSKVPKEGSKKVDFVNYNNKYYSFESEDSVKKFIDHPQFYLEIAMQTVAKESELIHLLNLEDRLPKSVILSGDDKQKRKQMINIAMQTEVHPIDGYIDPKYEWSEWKLRKLALKFAKLRTKRTHSTQTSESHFRRSNETQVDSKEDQPVGTRTRDQQTRKETGTNPVQHFTYIKGLRSVGNNAQLVKMEFDPMDKEQVSNLRNVKS